MVLRQGDAVVGVLGPVTELFPVIVPVCGLQHGVLDGLEEDGGHGGTTQGLGRLDPAALDVRRLDDAADHLVDALHRRIPVGHPGVDYLAVASLPGEVHRHLGGVLDAQQAVLIGVAQPVDGGEVFREPGLCFGGLVESARYSDSPG